MPERRSAPSLTALVLVGAALYGAYSVREGLTPFVLAAAFAYVVNPAAIFFEAKGLRRGPVIAAGYGLALLLLGAAYLVIKPLIVSESAHLIANAPKYFHMVQKLATAGEATLIQRLPLPQKVAENAFDSLIGSALDKLQDVPSSLLLMLPLLAHGLLVPFIGFFFLLDGMDGYERLIQNIPSRYVEQAIHLTAEIDTALGNYLRGLIIVAIAIGTATFVGLSIMGVDNAFAISILCGVSSFVPYMGVVVGMIVGGGVAWIQFASFMAAAKVIALFFLIRIGDEIFLQPIIARTSVHMHPMANLLALIVGGEMFGFLGLLFAVPAACVLKALIQVTWSYYASESGLEGDYATDETAIPYT